MAEGLTCTEERGINGAMYNGKSSIENDHHFKEILGTGENSLIDNWLKCVCVCWAFVVLLDLIRYIINCLIRIALSTLTTGVVDKPLGFHFGRLPNATILVLTLHLQCQR